MTAAEFISESREPDELQVRVEGAVLTVVFNRPKAHNAITFDMYEALYAVCEHVDANPNIRTMVLRGAGGKAFVAGTDIPQLQRFTAERGGLAYERLVEKVISRLEQVRVPVVAAVEGVAAGAGVILVLAADLCLCTPESRFGAPIARTLGNCLSLENCARLERAVGVRRAKAVLYTAAMLPAQEALSAGLVNEIAEQDEYEARLQDLVGQLAQNAPLSLQVFKEAYGLLAEPTAAEDNARLIELCYNSADFQEGLRAFQAKRRPVWSGK